MRLFTGIAIADRVVAHLEQALAPLRSAAPIKWSPAANFHITTKFIGAWPDARLSELTDALAAIDPPGPFEIAVARFGFVPNPHRPRVLLAGVQAGPGLAELVRKIEDALEPLGSAREQRAYTPHVTLARIANEDIRSLREHIASMTNFDFGSFEATDFHLYLSRPERGGSVYSSLAAFPLTKSVPA